MSEQPLLGLSDVVKHYGPHRALTVASLKLHRGESLLLYGRNGFGKSTLLRILAGVTTIDAGRVERGPLLSKARLGYLPQIGGLYGDLTVRENLRLRRRIYGLPRIAESGLWYLDELNLTRYLDRRVLELSGGFQRLAGIAATLHAAPHWLLLDEPLTAVDSAAREVLKRRFAEILPRMELCIVAAPDKDGDLASMRHIEMLDGRIA